MIRRISILTLAFALFAGPALAGSMGRRCRRSTRHYEARHHDQVRVGTTRTTTTTIRRVRTSGGVTVTVETKVRVRLNRGKLRGLRVR